MPTIDDLRAAGEKNMQGILAKLDKKHRVRVQAQIERYGRVQDIPEEFWDELQREIEDEQVKAIMLLILASDEWTTEEVRQQGVVKRRIIASQTDAAISAAQQVRRTAAQTVDTLRNRLARRVEDAMASGPGDVGELTRDGIDQAINDVFTKERRATIATDQTTTAFSTGQRDAAERIGRGGITNEQGQRVTLELTWRTERDNLVCHRCSPFEGQPESVWSQVFPEGPGPAAHPNCILPGQLACVPGLMPAATDSFYVGWCVEIVCKSGRRLSVTEDHMVLTGRGYCRASGVVQGDDVFASTDPERIAAFVDPDNNHCPAMIEEIFAASMMSSGMATSRVPVASEDFNGNARLLVSQVQVVDSESHLRDSADPGFMQLGSNSAFGGIQPCKSLNRFSPKELFPPRLDATTSCIMCGRDLPYPLPFVHSLPLNQFGGRLASRFNTDANESFTERTPRDARCFGKDICGFAGDVPIGKALHSGNVYAKRFDRQSVSLRRRSQANTQSLQHISASTSTDAKLAGKFLRRFARLVTPDKVVRVRRFKFADHVYDLECDPWRLLFCNGVIIHNCRCFLQPQVIVEEE